MLCFIGILYDLSDSNSISVSVLSFPDFPVVRWFFLFVLFSQLKKTESRAFIRARSCNWHIARAFIAVIIVCSWLQVEKYPADISYIYPIIYLVIFALCSILPTIVFFSSSPYRWWIVSRPEFARFLLLLRSIINRHSNNEINQSMRVKLLMCLEWEGGFNYKTPNKHPTIAIYSLQPYYFRS